MVNWSAFKRIVATATFSGILAGLLLTAVQQLQIKPIISQAEVYEQAAAKNSASSNHGHTHEEADHDHHSNVWQPADGAERTAFTALANISLAIGFGLFLTAAFSLRDISSKKISANPVSHKTDGWRAGLLWGLAGYVVFFVAPSLGLPPELPGTQSAPLHDRQLWWLLTTLMSAIGLYLLVLVKPTGFKALGLLLIITPYIIGAPEPLTHASAALEELASAFIQATAIANALFWLSLGALMGYFYKLFA